jgi:hypothetical protein
MKHTPFDKLNHKQFDPNKLAQARRDVKRALTLAEVRKAREFTQTQLAQSLETTQPGVSAIERRADLYVSTMRSYVEALGGRLEITAVFPEGAVPIDTFSELEDDEAEVPA